MNSFPFTEARPAKQYEDDGPDVDFNSVADASAGGRRCIDKVINETEYFQNVIHTYSGYK